MSIFIRERHSNRAISRQIVETYRQDGKVRQRVLANLGSHATISEAMDACRHELEWRLRYVERLKTRRCTRHFRPARQRQIQHAERQARRAQNALERLNVVSEIYRRRDSHDTTDVVSQTSRRRDIHDTTRGAP